MLKLYIPDEFLQYTGRSLDLYRLGIHKITADAGHGQEVIFNSLLVICPEFHDINHFSNYGYNEHGHYHAYNHKACQGFHPRKLFLSPCCLLFLHRHF